MYLHALFPFFQCLREHLQHRALFLSVRGLNSNAVLKCRHTKHWGDARIIPLLPGQANSTDSKNNVTPWLQKKADNAL